jgi:hypothetical protein
MATDTDQTRPPGKKRGFPLGKIIILLIVLVMVAGALLYFRIPQKTGLIKSPADRLFTITPDREKAGAIMSSLEEAGFDIRGIEVYVLPVSGSGDSVAMIVLDASKGFDFSQPGRSDPFNDFLGVIAGTRELGINRVAVAYYNEDGDQLLAATLPTDAAAAYAQGKLTDQQLMEEVNIGTDDLTAFIGEVQKYSK